MRRAAIITVRSLIVLLLLGAAFDVTLPGRTRDRIRIHPGDEEGRIPLGSVLAPPRQDTLVYCCGPESLLVAVEGWCTSWPVGSLHFERFKANCVECECCSGFRCQGAGRVRHVDRDLRLQPRYGCPILAGSGF